MPCEVIHLPGGGTAIVCSRGRRQRCACGKPATLLCDWKVKGKRSGTCDKPLCASCSHSPAPEKDLCPEHAADWKARGKPAAPLGPPAQPTLFEGK
jgi:hypothetical protein